jgi:hypothetical protein
MRVVLVSAVLLGVLSCSDASAPALHGSVAFTYTGAGGGSFSAAGDAPSLSVAPPTGTTWTVGYVEDGDTYIAGSTPRADGRADLAILRLNRATPGTVTVDPACNIDGNASCAGMELLLNFNGNGDTGDFFCGLTTGTIVLTEMSGNRARGTFSGSGDCITGTGEDFSTFVVSNGTFDVALVAPPA